MTTSQDYDRTVKRTCKIVQLNGQPCGREYRVPVWSKSKGCPECAPRLDLYPGRDKADQTGAA